MMRASPPPLLLGLVTLLLFSVWGNSFIAIDELLGTGPGRGGVLDWWELMVARYGVVALCMAAYLAACRGGETVRLLARSWPRLLLLGLLTVPAYGFCLFFAQEKGVPPAIASLSTAAVPLFLMVLGGVFLHERIGPAKILGFVVATAGMVMIAVSKDLGPRSFAYPVLVVIALGAPLSWALYSVIVKPMLRQDPPLLVMFVCVTLVGLPLLLGLDARLWAKLRGVGSPAFGWREWLLLLYLIGPCTLFGFPVWNWLVKHLPASTVGFTVFLNPPLTFAFSFLLQGSVPVALEAAGAAVVLLGVAVVVFFEERVRRGLDRRRRSRAGWAA
jgi:O-acetylserine/cysteine efflux transporter